jgi:hypothetical protein
MATRMILVSEDEFFKQTTPVQVEPLPPPPPPTPPQVVQKQPTEPMPTIKKKNNQEFYILHLPANFQKVGQRLLNALQKLNVSRFSFTTAGELIINGRQIEGSDISVIIYLLAVPFSEQKYKNVVGHVEGLRNMMALIRDTTPIPITWVTNPYFRGAFLNKGGEYCRG